MIRRLLFRRWSRKWGVTLDRQAAELLAAAGDVTRPSFATLADDDRKRALHRLGVAATMAAAALRMEAANRR